MPVSDLPVSAGLGAFLEGEMFQQIQVPASSVPAGTEFGIYVTYCNSDYLEIYLYVSNYFTVWEEIIMARPKGSKNKTRIVNANVDYAAVVAEKTAEKEKIESEVAALTANLDDLKTQLKAKKAELKAATKELTKAENKKAAAEAKAMEEAKKGEAEDVLKKLLASGMTAEEILAKLQ